MAVKIGSARIDENGRISGGKAGDQTGREVSTQAYYVHSKGWDVLRPKRYTVAQKVALAAQRACDNDNIGYDQSQRNTLFNQIKSKGFDPKLATIKCETDCSALVRVCVHFAGVSVGDFTTSSEAAKLLATGEFVKLTADKYTKGSDYLRRGDILVTKTKGHTAVVLSNGSKAGVDGWVYEGQEPEAAKPETVTVSRGQWYIRSGAGTQFHQLTIVEGGSVLTVKSSTDGWLCVDGVDRAGKKFVDGWISKKAVV